MDPRMGTAGGTAAAKHVPSSGQAEMVFAERAILDHRRPAGKYGIEGSMGGIADRCQRKWALG